MYAEDAVIEDPVGPSMFDPDGKGHHGHDGIRAFWELAIAPIETFHFTIHDSHANGSTCANIGTITTTFPDGGQVDTDLVMVYTVHDDGRVASMRAYWEPERAMGDLPQGAEPLSAHRRWSATHSTSGRSARQSSRTRSSSSGVWITGSKPWESAGDQRLVAQQLDPRVVGVVPARAGLEPVAADLDQPSASEGRRGSARARCRCGRRRWRPGSRPAARSSAS